MQEHEELVLKLRRAVTELNTATELNANEATVSKETLINARGMLMIAANEIEKLKAEIEGLESVKEMLRSELECAKDREDVEHANVSAINAIEGVIDMCDGNYKLDVGKIEGILMMRRAMI